MTVAASAIVCTLDRGPAIEETIASLLAQEPPDGGFEVLIVDNASRRANAELLRALAARHAPLVRYVREERLGESAARNCALREAHGAILAFLDDDAVAEPQWLRALSEPFADPTVGAAGGPIRLRYETPPPAWLDARLTPYLSAFDAGTAATDLHYPDYPRGANMAFRRSVFEAAGPFSERYGRRAACLMSYSETEMCWRVERAGWRIVYAPTAWVDHIVPPGRLEPDWFRRRIHWQGRSMALFEAEHLGVRHVLKQVPLQLAKCLVRPRLHRARHAGWLSAAMLALLHPPRQDGAPPFHVATSAKASG